MHTPMSSSERPGGAEFGAHYAAPSFQVSRFRNDPLSISTYNALHGLLFTNHCDLSTYRFLLDHVSHVAVQGRQPPQALEQSIRSHFSQGESVVVPSEVRAALAHRRRLVAQIAPWVEGH